jgi:phage FluMu protein Com
MSTYNILYAVIRCPQCEQVSEMEIDTFFGYRDFLEYRMGDQVEWWEGKRVKNGGRPEGGNLSGDGFAVCPRCKFGYWVRVQVQSDTIVAVESNLKKKSLLSDEHAVQ